MGALTPHPPLTPTPSPSHLPAPIYSIRDITGAEKTIQKPTAFKGHL